MQGYELIVIGAGVAGLTAAMTAARHGVKVAVVDRVGVGGQIANAERIDDFPGFPQGIGGHELGPLLHEQAETAGAEFLLDTVEALEIDGDRRVVRCATQNLRAQAIIIAVGSSLRSLGVPGEDEFAGRGVSHCASCDGPLFAGRNVCVVGGGDTAFYEAPVLAQHAARVTLFHQEPHANAQAVLQSRAASAANIDIVPQTAVEAIIGTETVTAVRVRDVVTNAVREHATSGVFIYVGFMPNTDFLRSVVPLDARGHVETDIGLATSVPGVFAAGTVRAHATPNLATVAGDGATAATSAVRYLQRNAG